MIMFTMDVKNDGDDAKECENAGISPLVMFVTAGVLRCELPAENQV